MMLGDFFFTATPCNCTMSGITGMANCTRFCTSTWAMFRSVPSCERDRQRVGAVVGALRRHVEHVLHAVDLLLDRRGHGVEHQLGVGAG